ncbi:MAG: PQQ-binding-like beta-propeller repeat protein [Chloroflexia bacterium]|nr:PQQ-binding-like beta-propeller repeat protein [Chloroflexia bacterium]
MKKIRLTLILLFFVAFSSNSQVLTEWRNGGTGVYSESGLLEQWPNEGPEMLWHNDTVGDGHSSASIAYETIYITGKVDSMDVLFALDMDGKLKWKTAYGKAWIESFPDSRSTPTIDNKKIYVSSGLGDIACIDAITGKILWSVNAAVKYRAKFNDWGVAESLLIKDDVLFFSPIGKETTTIALNKNTGEPIWKAKALEIHWLMFLRYW